MRIELAALPLPLPLPLLLLLLLLLLSSRAAGAAGAAGAAPLDDDVATAEAAYQGLRYDDLLVVVERILSRSEATAKERMRAYYLQGSALAAMNRQLDAETSFRFLLRGEPDWDIPQDTPPKIAAVFRKVQVEERAIREETKRSERERIIARLNLTGGPTQARHVGGTAMELRFALKDPDGAVRHMRLSFRRDTASAFSSTPATRDAAGAWKAQIPASATESEVDYTMEYFLEAIGQDGAPLVALGSADKPLALHVERGLVSGPFYSTPWFWIIAGSAGLAVSGAAAAVAIIATQPPQSDLPIARVPGGG